VTVVGHDVVRRDGANVPSKCYSFLKFEIGRCGLWSQITIVPLFQRARVSLDVGEAHGER